MIKKEGAIRGFVRNHKVLSFLIALPASLFLVLAVLLLYDYYNPRAFIAAYRDYREGSYVVYTRGMWSDCGLDSRALLHERYGVSLVNFGCIGGDSYNDAYSRAMKALLKHKYKRDIFEEVYQDACVKSADGAVSFGN
ncbi:MAG TPA: hypothetical protein DDW67_08640 [Elusimicrobia bacterium]|nr:hypothetical protein [Elusimicrobiota bacterium]